MIYSIFCNNIVHMNKDQLSELKGEMDALNVRFEALLSLLMDDAVVTMAEYKRSLAKLIKEYRQLRGLE